MLIGEAWPGERLHSPAGPRGLRSRLRSPPRPWTPVLGALLLPRSVQEQPHRLEPRAPKTPPRSPTAPGPGRASSLRGTVPLPWRGSPGLCGAGGLLGGG